MQQAVENLIPIQILFTKELLLYIQQILNHSQLYISAQCLHHLAPFEFAIRIERLINIDKQLNNLTWCISPYGIQKWHCPPFLSSRGTCQSTPERGPRDVEHAVDPPSCRQRHRYRPPWLLVALLRPWQLLRYPQ